MAQNARLATLTFSEVSLKKYLTEPENGIAWPTMKKPAQSNSEAAFENWKARNESALLAANSEYDMRPSNFYGVAGNFSYFCRQVYTGRIQISQKLV